MTVIPRSLPRIGLGSHAVYVSQPQAVAHFIEQVATGALAAGRGESGDVRLFGSARGGSATLCKAETGRRDAVGLHCRKNAPFRLKVTVESRNGARPGPTGSRWFPFPAHRTGHADFLHPAPVARAVASRHVLRRTHRIARRTGRAASTDPSGTAHPFPDLEMSVLWAYRRRRRPARQRSRHDLVAWSIRDRFCRANKRHRETLGGSSEARA
jgi:hypothetical protein